MRELMSGRGERDLVPGHLRLYRTWRIATDPPLPLRFSRPTVIGAKMVPLEDVTVSLMSTGWSVTWSGEMTAECLRRHPPNDLMYVLHDGVTRVHGPAPEAGCSCGVHGWYDPRDTRMVAAPVIGAIEAWGRCVLGSNGAKVERARLLAIAPNPFFPQSNIFRRELDLVMGRMADEGYRVYPSYDALLEDLPPISVRALAGDPVPMGQLLDAQDRVAQSNTSMADAMEQLRVVAHQAGNAFAAGLMPLIATPPAAVVDPRWSACAAHRRCLCAVLAVLDAALGAVGWAAYAVGCAAFNFLAWRFESIAPWRWARGRGRHRV
jgi:hypothetical protein